MFLIALDMALLWNYFLFPAVSEPFSNLTQEDLETEMRAAIRRLRCAYFGGAVLALLVFAFCFYRPPVVWTPLLFFTMLTFQGLLLGRIFTQLTSLRHHFVFFHRVNGKEVLAAAPRTSRVLRVVCWHGEGVNAFDLHWSDGSQWRIPPQAMDWWYLKFWLFRSSLGGYSIERRAVLTSPSSVSAS